MSYRRKRRDVKSGINIVPFGRVTRVVADFYGNSANY